MKKMTMTVAGSIIVAGLVLAGCGANMMAQDTAKPDAPASVVPDPATIDKMLKDKQATRVSLFDGKTLAGWTWEDGKPVDKGWIVEDGTIFRKESGGSIHTAKEYGNFVFDIEWKVAAKSNSGIKYRFGIYDNGKSKMANGPEYQILDDDTHPDAKLGDGKRKTACLYDIMKTNEEITKAYKKPGEWNKTRIVAVGSHVQHWLNGKMVLEYDFSTDAFKQAVQASKFKDYPGYGTRLTGRIHLQEHNDPVWYRAISIIELPATEKPADKPADKQ